VARQVTLYTLRFRETVFVQNLLDDDRFSNVSESYLTRNPEGKAVICIPIVHSDHLLGSIYVEGPPNSFTERNTQVLRLLVNQISISLANALLFKEVERVSASNEAMLEMQKRALAQARAAEIKAKEAEAIAVRNMQLKEEAVLSERFSRAADASQWCYRHVGTSESQYSELRASWLCRLDSSVR
jgi:GAF domain-containing protein